MFEKADLNMEEHKTIEKRTILCTPKKAFSWKKKQ